ncbi:MAG: YodL domain-containing protein [Faecalibacterium prausnitzii]
MKDDAVIKDNEAVYLLNEQTYLHLRENLQGVGYEVFDKNSPLPVEEGQIPREVLGNTQRRIETARAYYLAEHQDEPVGRIQNVAVTTLEKFRSGVRKRRNLAPRSLPENDVRFIDPQYNELFRVPDGGVVQMTYPDGHQRSEVVEYIDDYHMKIGSSVQHICEFAERMARSHAIVEPEPLTQQEQRAWNLEYDYYLTVQAEGVLYSHNLRNKDCIPLCQEEFAQKLADRNEIQSYRMKQFQQSGHDCYLVMQLQQDADPVLRFAVMRYLNKQNIAPSIENYEILYRGNLPEGKRSVPQAELLEQLYQKFNCARPTDYHGHSLSVSDVIMLNQDGKISAHYVDSIGFKELPGFLDKKPERPSVLMNLKEKCDAPECNPTVCRKAREAHEL